MKFWQLASITNKDFPGLIVRVASTSAAWHKYGILAGNFSALVNAQNRSALDSFVEKDFVTQVLAGVQQKLYLSSDNWLRVKRLDATDQEISVLDSFIRYGADVVEEVNERGSAELK